MRKLNPEALKARGERLATDPSATVNGIDYIIVDTDTGSGTAKLHVHFFNQLHLPDFVKIGKSGDAGRIAGAFLISGGHRVPAGLADGDVRVVGIDQPDPNQPVLDLTVKPLGDYSTYSLTAVTGGNGDFDPLFNGVPLKFWPQCLDACAPEWDAPPPKADQPAIDYLAKDYDSFRHTLVSAMMERVPGWTASSEADLDQVLLSLFSAAADELSDYQDRVMNEAYFSTARKRVSLVRHARLMDYHANEGNQASTWVSFALSQANGLAGDVLAAGSQVTTTRSPGDEASAVFLTLADQRLDPLLNELHLYTWGNTLQQLTAGSTTADLCLDEHATQADAQKLEAAIRALNTGSDGLPLVIEEALNPVTGTVLGCDVSKRQLLRLVSGDHGAKAMQDPVEGKWFVRITWGDDYPLAQDYDFVVDSGHGRFENVSVFRGNLVQAYHGLRVPAQKSTVQPDVLVFKDPSLPINAVNGEYAYEPGGKWGVLCRLPFGPLAYREKDGDNTLCSRSTLRVAVVIDGESQEWKEVESFVHSRDGDEDGNHFVVETDELGRSLIRFGNGLNGRRLPDLAEVHCWYQLGYGPAGNIGADSLVYAFDPTGKAIDGVECSNPFDVTNGRAPESAAEISRNAPEAYRSKQLRAVTLGDYEDRAREIQGVSNAKASYVWTGSWRAIRLAIDPAGTTELLPSLRDRIEGAIEVVRMIGDDIEIRAPRFVPLEIDVYLCIGSDFWRQDIQDILEQTFSTGFTPDGELAFFNPDRWTFDQDLKVSELFSWVQGIEGVIHVSKVSIQRVDINTPAVDDSDFTVQGDEIILVANDPDQGERGTITFHIDGGRK